MSEPRNNRKDEILEALVDAKQRRDKLRQEYRNAKADNEILESQKDSLEDQVKQLQSKLIEVSQLWHKSRFEARDLEQAGAECSQEVSRLERELSRIIDAERVKLELASMAQQFRESCLEAAWRSENRQDGMGAKSYQIDGAVHLAVTQRAMLGDDMGLGKTLTALIACDLTDAKKVIVICPSDTMHNFCREVRLWTPHRFPVVLGQLPRLERDIILETLPLSEQYMLIVNYEAWRKDPDLLTTLKSLKADTIIIDESHNIMNSKTDAASGVTELVFAGNYCSGCYDPVVKKVKENLYRCQCGIEAMKWEFTTVRRVFPISGTGIMNRPQDLFSQLHLVDPENFPDMKSYLWDFCEMNWQGRWGWKSGGESRLVKLIGPRYISRTQKDAGIELPPLKPVEHLITQEMFKDFYPKQWKAYQQAREWAQVILDPDKKLVMSMPNRITVLLRLRQVLVWPNAIELFSENEDGYKETIAKLDIYESIKVDKAEELIKQFNENGDRVVVFSQFTDGIAELHRRLGTSSVIYDGSTTKKLKQAVQLDFDVKTSSDTPRWQSVLAHYKSGGVGLNFNTANHVIYLDPPWNPGTEDQAKARTHRIGQTKDVHVHHIRVEKSVDTWMADIIQQKRNIIGGFEEQSDIYQKAYDALRDGEM